MQNSPSNGLEILRKNIADYLRQFRGIDVAPDNIVIGAGSEAMYNLIIQLLGHDLNYSCEDPGYEKISLMFNANKLNFIKIPLDNYGIIPDILYKKNINVVHVTPSHHFPTGITMPAKRRYELLNWANSSSDRIIIEDDYDSEFRHTGRPIPSLYSMDSNEKVIYINTFSKSLASTIRISYMVLPTRLMAAYQRKLSFYSCTVSTFEQLTLARFMSTGFFEKHINHMRTSSRKKRNLLLSSLKKSNLRNIMKIREEQAGLHFLMELHLDNVNLTDEEFMQKCSANGVHISTVSPNTYMVNYSSVPLDKIEEAVRRMDVV